MKRLIIFFISITIFAIISLLIVIKTYNPDNLGIELTKSLLQILVIVIFGQLVSLLVSNTNRQRQKNDALKEFRKTILNKLNEGYSEAKKARRLIRAKGFFSIDDSRNKALLVHQETYDEQIQIINDVQLNFETMGKEIVASSNAFSNPKNIVTNMRAMEEYLKLIISEYEKVFSIFKGNPAVLPIEQMPRLNDFVGPYKKSDFRNQFVQTYTSVLKTIQADMLSSEQ